MRLFFTLLLTTFLNVPCYGSQLPPTQQRLHSHATRMHTLPLQANDHEKKTAIRQSDEDEQPVLARRRKKRRKKRKKRKNRKRRKRKKKSRDNEDEDNEDEDEDEEEEADDDGAEATKDRFNVARIGTDLLSFNRQTFRIDFESNLKPQIGIGARLFLHFDLGAGLGALGRYYITLQEDDEKVVLVPISVFADAIFATNAWGSSTIVQVGAMTGIRFAARGGLFVELLTGGRYVIKVAGLSSYAAGVGIGGFYGSLDLIFGYEFPM